LAATTNTFDPESSVKALVVEAKVTAAAPVIFPTFDNAPLLITRLLMVFVAVGALIAPAEVMVPVPEVEILPLVVMLPDEDTPPGILTCNPLRPIVMAVVVPAVPTVRAVVVVPASRLAAYIFAQTRLAEPMERVLLVPGNRSAPMAVLPTLLSVVVAPVPAIALQLGAVVRTPPVKVAAVTAWLAPHDTVELWPALAPTVTAVPLPMVRPPSTERLATPVPLLVTVSVLAEALLRSIESAVPDFWTEVVFEPKTKAPLSESKVRPLPVKVPAVTLVKVGVAEILMLPQVPPDPSVILVPPPDN
jgi:hypothetical protein